MIISVNGDEGAGSLSINGDSTSIMTYDTLFVEKAPESYYPVYYQLTDGVLKIKAAADDSYLLFKNKQAKDNLPAWT